MDFDLKPDGSGQKWMVELYRRVSWVAAGRILQVKITPAGFPAGGEIEKICFASIREGPAAAENPQKAKERKKGW